MGTWTRRFGDAVGAGNALFQSAYDAGLFHVLTSLLFVQGFSYLSQLILARLLAPSDFGIVRSVEVVLSIATMLGSLGMPTLAVAFIAKIDDARLRGILLGRLVIIAAVASFVSAALTSLAGPMLVAPAAARYLGMLSWIVVIVAISRTCLNYFQGVEQFQRMSVLSVVLSALSIGTLVAAASLAGLSGWVVGRYMGEALFALGSLVMVGRIVRFGGDLDAAYAHRRLIAQGAGVASSLAIRSLLDNVGLLLLGRWGQDTQSLGHYGLSSLIITIASVLPASIANLSFPRLVGQSMQPGGMWGLYKRVAYRCLVVTMPAAALVAMGSPLLALVFGRQYLPSVGVLRILPLILPLRAVSTVSAIPLLAQGSVHISVLINLASLSAGVALCAYAIPLFGIYGAAWATVAIETVSALAYMTCVWTRVRRHSNA